jgi:hypothetical protein
MNDTTVVHDTPTVGPGSCSGSGDWGYNSTALSLSPGRRAMPASHPVHPWRGLALLLAVSTLTSTVDPWAEHRQERSGASLAISLGPSTKRRILPSEARRIALELLHRSEQRREESLRGEASHEICWEEPV